ncbi:MAG TPA: hypothetical protein VN843_09825 [Anaerolineales bacterium]|nr:hypothetical protein [Anaerolineales bacterium]
MPGYRVSIIGHIDLWRMPPDGSLPKEIVQVFNVDADSDAQLNSFIDERMADIAGSGAMKAYLDPNKRQIGKLDPWITVPLHMITHLSYRVQLLAGEVPVYSKAEGKSIVPSGKDVIVQ